MKLLVVGLGSMGKRRARLAMRLSCEVSGVDKSSARCEEARTLGVRTFASLEDALAEGGFAAALVCTAPLSHAAIIGRLLDAGVPVFSEINLVSDGYTQLIMKAKAVGLPLFLSSTMLYRGEIEYITNTVHNAKDTCNYIYHIGQYLPDWHPWENYKDFFVGDKRTGGVREILGIELPWLVQCFGEARPVCVQNNRLSGLEIDYPDSSLIVLAHAGGATGMLAVDVVCPKAVRNLEVYGEGTQLFWEGSPASLYRYDAETRAKLPVNTYTSIEHDSRYSDNIVENAYIDELLNFFGVLKGAEAPRWSFEQDQQVIDLIEAIEAL